MSTQVQKSRPPKWGLYLSIAQTVFTLVIFLEFIATTYTALGAGIRVFLMVLYFGIPTASFLISLLAMYGGRRDHFRAIDLWASTLLPGVITLFLIAAFILAKVIGV